MPSLNFGILDWILPSLGLILFVFVIYQVRAQRQWAWLEEVLINDRQQLVDRLNILDVNYEFSVESTEPFIDVLVKVKNCAIFPIKIIGVEGSLVIGETPCLDRITSRDTFRLGHFHWGTVRITQAIRNETAYKIINYRETKQKIPITLSGCYLVVKSEEPNYNVNPIKVHIGFRDEVELIKL